MNPISHSAQPGPSNDAGDAVYRARAQAAAEKFEAFFITDMLRQMRRSTQALADADSPINSKTHQDMMDLTDTMMGDSLAGQRAFGIADAILRQLLPGGTAPAEAIGQVGALKVSAPVVAVPGKEPSDTP